MQRVIKTKSKKRFLEAEWNNIPLKDREEFFKTFDDFQNHHKNKISKCEYCGILYWNFGKQRCKCDLI